ncbi:PTS system D-fructose-specific IIA component (F1P-forming), Frc family /PTS system D-fructose-specific IIB component (F1P-forming), Frc family /PTS system D-fructose-specific IIC component (F1P-forming), Frc family [Arthrobacter subterraneus]|uniref:PTS system D-fructose-specific IIA component (F1P-forming), Frc family /PTS system D-fructose-specific IIB component (F1P-forming), Frc family /PTS system D-fructose-specific IIC component (F1P-for... n=1 Tax=Arthrobacter subterraneus TaxID=335973 RepID=A0A1G8M3B7_9MICC|nr:fructose-specific PTS transporter subunit EIIC [Arthrobacter subterraneus]SDI62277.1 PTS system D-fructose-specific IIA component (F1P-forming), Frc family /PTS system D-fructose-specific IIB component (F1P-forming), Frc family /PTS system D-fructose-specific IIC component (F1P-forming), Frc family [Arthrobacter subterraneus]
MSAMITPELVVLDKSLGNDRAGVIRRLAELVVAQGRADQVEGLFADALAREEKTATGIPGGIAIPHCRSTAVLEPTLAMARLEPKVDFGAKDGPADLVFFIAAPEGADQQHLKLLSKLARSLIKKDFTAALRAASSEQEIVALVEEALDAGPAKKEGGATSVNPESADPGTTTPPVAARTKRLIAVTACPTGIAHTYMAADSLVAAAKERGIDLQVETQGSSASTPLDPSVIAAADAVIFAVDVDVRDKHRFAGKPVINAPVKRGIDEPGVMVEEALAAADNPNARRVADSSTPGTHDDESGSESIGGQLKRALLTGVSYMIPFVAGGGLLIALGFLLGGYDITGFADDMVVNNSLWNLPTEFPETASGALGAYLGAVLFKIGALSMGFLVPALAGYIAYALADRPGIAPGFVAGAVAGFMGAGFLGAIVGGLLAGYVAMKIGKLSVPRWLRGLMPVVIIPLVASIVASGLMILILGGPIAGLTVALNDWLSGLTGAGALLLGVILGLMMAIDLGGPINKVAYAFAVAGLGAGTVANQAPWQIMAAVMAAGMVPPLAMALATVIDRRRFSLAERENGKAAWLLGSAFISEGAIPFAAADPLRVIPAGMLGSAVTGAIIMGTGVTSQAPHGGIFVFFAIGNVVMFVVAILVGMVISALAVVALKRFAVRKPVPAAASESVAA